MIDDVKHRFCQQCGRFHNLADFDGDKRSCRARLVKHNARRRKKVYDVAFFQPQPKRFQPDTSHVAEAPPQPGLDRALLQVLQVCGA